MISQNPFNMANASPILRVRSFDPRILAGLAPRWRWDPHGRVWASRVNTEWVVKRASLLGFGTLLGLIKMEPTPPTPLQPKRKHILTHSHFIPSNAMFVSIRPFCLDGLAAIALDIAVCLCCRDVSELGQFGFSDPIGLLPGLVAKLTTCCISVAAARRSLNLLSLWWPHADVALGYQVSITNTRFQTSLSQQVIAIVLKRLAP